MPRKKTTKTADVPEVVKENDSTVSANEVVESTTTEEVANEATRDSDEELVVIENGPKGFKTNRNRQRSTNVRRGSKFSRVLRHNASTDKIVKVGQTEIHKMRGCLRCISTDLVEYVVDDALRTTIAKAFDVSDKCKFYLNMKDNGKENEVYLLPVTDDKLPHSLDEFWNLIAGKEVEDALTTMLRFNKEHIKDGSYLFSAAWINAAFLVRGANSKVLCERLKGLIGDIGKTLVWTQQSKK